MNNSRTPDVLGYLAHRIVCDICKLCCCLRASAAAISFPHVQQPMVGGSGRPTLRATLDVPLLPNRTQVGYSNVLLPGIEW